MVELIVTAHDEPSPARVRDVGRRHRARGRVRWCQGLGPLLSSRVIRVRHRAERRLGRHERVLFAEHEWERRAVERRRVVFVELEWRGRPSFVELERRLRHRVRGLSRRLEWRAQQGRRPSCEPDLLRSETQRRKQDVQGRDGGLLWHLERRAATELRLQARGTCRVRGRDAGRVRRRIGLSDRSGLLRTARGDLRLLQGRVQNDMQGLPRGPSHTLLRSEGGRRRMLHLQQALRRQPELAWLSRLRGLIGRSDAARLLPSPLQGEP